MTKPKDLTIDKERIDKELQTNDGDILLVEDCLLISCCDCGKTHACIFDEVIIREEGIFLKPNKRLLAMRVYDVEDATQFHRDRDGITIHTAKK